MAYMMQPASDDTDDESLDSGKSKGTLESLPADSDPYGLFTPHANALSDQFQRQLRWQSASADFLCTDLETLQPTPIDLAAMTSVSFAPPSFSAELAVHYRQDIVETFLTPEFDDRSGSGLEMANGSVAAENVPRQHLGPRTSNSLAVVSISSHPPPTKTFYERWLECFCRMKEYYNQHGHCNIPIKKHNDPEMAALGEWVKRQRYNYKRLQQGKSSSLTNERILMLDSIGFVWQVYNKQWESQYRSLVAYKKMRGNCNVPRHSRTYPRLANWAKRQRRDYHSGQMSADRIEQLESIGFQWNVQRHPTKKKSTIGW